MTRRQFAAAIALQARPRPNIVFILTDDLGLNDLACYGSREIRTPNIDRLARAGVRFTQCYSNGPLCSPTRAGFITGRYQQRSGIEYAWTPRNKGQGLPADGRSLPALLKKTGYRTALFGKWHLGEDPEFSPNAHGFDEFYGFLSSDHDFYSHKRTDGTPDLWHNTKPVESPLYSTDLFTARAVEFLQQPSPQPYFLCLALNAPHWPFQAPDRPADIRTRETWHNGTRQDYVQMVERIDLSVGRLLPHVSANTLVIFTNDNGGERLSDNSPAFHGKMTLWEGGVRVPAIMRWPGRIPPRSTHPHPAITMDFTATILAAAGVDDPALEGVNLLDPQKAAAERPLFWRYVHPPITQKSVRLGKWKYMLDGIHHLLFDLVADPSERRNIARLHPRKVSELQALLAGWESSVAASKPLHLIQ